LIVGQSGGPTATINASLAGVLAEAQQHPQIDGLIGMINGIEGLLREDLVDLSRSEVADLSVLRRTPAAVLGSCRYKVTPEDYGRILGILERYNIRYFLYAGGNDSMDTCHRVRGAAHAGGYNVAVIGIPKTVDNDLEFTDHSPGYGSAARVIALSVRDSGLDQKSLRTFVPILITEVMGRHAGWLAAASVLGKEAAEDAPHLVYVPERTFDEAAFVTDVMQCYREYGWVSVVVSEGIRDKRGELLGGKDAPLDAFGHKALPLGSGVGQYLAGVVHRETGLLTRVNRPGTIQRSLSCAVSEVDLREAEEVGRAAVRQAISGEDGYMITLVRRATVPYECTTGLAPLSLVANTEKHMPDAMINEAGNFVEALFTEYAGPLIGEEIPAYARLSWWTPLHGRRIQHE